MTYDFETEPDPIQAEKLHAAAMKILDGEIVALQHARMPSAVVDQLEAKRTEQAQRIAAWDNYKNTQGAEWVNNWSQVQQEMNDQASQLDRAILTALQELQKLCLERAEAACLQRERELKRVEWGSLPHDEKMAILSRSTRIMGKAVHAARGNGSHLAPEVFRIFADFALEHPDLESFL